MRQQNSNVLCFLDKCRAVVETKPTQTFASWYNVDGEETSSYTFRELWDEAGTIAYHLRVEWQLEKGDQVILCYNFGLHFFASFLGCLRAGIVAILVYPPAPPLTTSLTKMNKVVKQCKAKLVLTDRTIFTLRLADGLNPRSKSRDLWPKLDLKKTDSLQKTKKSWLAGWNLRYSEDKSPSSSVLSYDEQNISSMDVAFLQYTSGSTGVPKGVMITHGALTHNVQHIHNLMADHSSMVDDVTFETMTLCHWLPQYHDAGLVACTAAPFAAGQRVHVLSPMDFLRRPITWLEVASREKANWLFAPNFSYDLVARKFSEGKTAHPSSSLDLSRLFSIYSSAEPIQPETVANFLTVFEAHGVRPDAMATAYGLAETVVAACAYRGVVPSKTHPNLVAVGHRDKMFSAEVRIVDSGRKEQVPDGINVDTDPMGEVPDGTVGEIWLSGPSVAAGYYGRPTLSQQVFGAQHSSEKDQGKSFLRTGDLGFFENDYLYICGRIKDLIIVNGVNHYPQDIEFVVQEASPSVRPGCCAVFSSTETGSDGDLEIVFEVRKSQEANAMAVCQQVRLAVVTKLRLKPNRVVAIRERSICKTTSGKIQRRATREKLHQGLFDIVSELSEEASSPFTIPQTFSSAFQAEKGLDSTELVQDLEAGDNSDEFLKHQKFDQVMQQFFGGPVDQDQEWEELGLTSLSSVQLRDALAEQLFVTLPPSCFQTDCTPRQLADYVVNHSGTPIAILSKPLETTKSHKMPWILLDILQALGTVLHIVMFASAIVPAYHLSSELHQYLEASETFQVRGTFYRWLWLPVAVPLWIISYTVFIILSKWIVVGRYSEGRIQAPSVAYLRWWWVDRGVHLFEFWVGRFIQDTFLLWIVYSLMGAKIHPTAKIDAFIREFDLVRIGPRASLKHQLRCRKFEPWSGSDSGPSLRFRRTTLAADCTVEGALSPGTSVGKGSAVAKRAVVPEGGQIPDFSLARGNPAFLDDLPDLTSKNAHNCCIEEPLKLVWLLVELYLFFSSLLIGQFLWSDLVLHHWRYNTLLYWPLLIVTSSLVSVLFGAILKWCFIGKLKPGQPVSQSPWTRTAHWAVDYHFQIGSSILVALICNSYIATILFKLYGMDIDFSSDVFLSSFLPSQMDLVKVLRSFVSVVSFDTESNEGEYAKTTIADSSIGYIALVCPGVHTSKTVVPPLSKVTRDLIHEENDSRLSQRKTGFDLFALKMATEFWYLVVIGIVWVAMIPAYELWMYFNPPSVELAALVLALCLVVQSVAWLCVLYLVQWLHQFLGKDGKPLFPLYVVYLTISWSVQYWTMLPTLFGSRLYNGVAWLLGARFEGRALYFGQHIQDFNQQTFADGTIVDGAIVGGHSLVYGDLTYGPNRLSGVYHEKVFQTHFVGSNPPDVGPWKAVVGTTTGQQKAEMTPIVVDV